MTTGFCPQCGSPRQGSLRYCATCAFDFGVAQSQTAAETPPAPDKAAPPTVTAVTPPRRGLSGGSAVLVIAIVLVAVGGFVFLLQGGYFSKLSLGGGTVDSANVPPAGSVWFGQSFDTSTFAIAGRKSSVGTNEAFAIVTHLTRSVDASQLVIRISWNGSLISSTAANATGSGDVWGFSGGPLYQAGTWGYEFTDIGGNVLASGQITANE